MSDILVTTPGDVTIDVTPGGDVTVGVTYNPVAGSGGGTNIGITRTASDVVVTSSSGTDGTILAADGSNAGVFTAADYTKLAAITGTNTGDQFIFKNVAVSGQNTVTAETTNDTLTLVAGTNVTITTDDTTDSITINASGGGGGGGDVVGPAGATDGAFALFDTNTGKLLKNGFVPGTGVATALAANVGSAGAPVVNGGALGTPSSGTLTSATGLPISTGVAGLGTGVATALAVNVGSAGAPVINGGALGAPSSGTLTSATGLPISTGVAGLGTGVATALAVNVGTAGSVVVDGGALGTPSSGTLTNATGLPLATGVTGTLPLANGGTGAALSDPGADRILFWDESANAFTWLTASTELTITTTSMTVRSASATTTGIVELATDAETNTGTDTARALTPANLTAWTGKTNQTSVGTLTVGTWNATPIATAYIADDAVTLAKMAAGTAGNLITYDASGNPAAAATGTAGQRLASNGAGAAPTFQSDALRIPVFFSDQTTDWSTGTKVTFTWRFGATTLSSTPFDCVTAPTGSVAQFDVKKNGTSMYSTKPTIDAGETSTDTAATPAVLSTTTLSNGDKVEIIIDQTGATIKGQGGVITFVGTTIP